MRSRHRLTVHPDLLSQASRHPGLRVGERDRFRADAALPTPHPTLRIDQRDRMRSPGQIVPRPIARRPHTPGPTTAATAAVAPASSALDPDRHPAVNGLAVTLGRHDPEPRQPQNPRTIPLRSHRSSLVVCTSREDGTRWSGVRGIALRTRPPSRPPQERGPRRRPGPQLKCVYSNRRRAQKRLAVRTPTCKSRLPPMHPLAVLVICMSTRRDEDQGRYNWLPLRNPLHNHSPSGAGLYKEEELDRRG